MMPLLSWKVVGIPKSMDIGVSLSGATASDLGYRNVFRYSPSRKPNASSDLTAVLETQASQFHVTDTSAALNIHFLPAFSPTCKSEPQRARHGHTATSGNGLFSEESALQSHTGSY